MKLALCARPGCGESFETGGPGRPPRFCSDACRQREFRTVEYLARQELARRYPEEYAAIRARITRERAARLAAPAACGREGLLP